eukprot:3331663-Rhodomonas_salina.2
MARAAGSMIREGASSSGARRTPEPRAQSSASEQQRFGLLCPHLLPPPIPHSLTCIHIPGCRAGRVCNRPSSVAQRGLTCTSCSSFVPSPCSSPGSSCL